MSYLNPDIEIDKMLEALYEHPEGYDRGDLLVTLEAAGHKFFKWQLPEKATKDDIAKLAEQFDAYDVLKSWRLRANALASIVLVLADIEGGRDKKIPGDVIKWLMRVSKEEDWEDENWADKLLKIAIKLPKYHLDTEDYLDKDFDKFLNIFSDDSEWFELANRYYERLVEDNDLDQDTRDDYSMAIICLTMYTPNTFDRRLDEMEDWFNGVSIQNTHLPYDIRNKEDVDLWFEANQATRYGCSSQHDPDVLLDSNEHVIEESIEEFVKSTGPMADWLSDQYEKCWYFKGLYEEFEKDDEKLPAIMYFFFADIEAALEAYPVLDDDHHSQLEMEAQVEAARDQIPHRLIGETPEVTEKHDWGGDVLNQLRYESWYPESTDGGHWIANWPGDEEVAQALLNLGYLTADVDEWINLLDINSFTVDEWINAVSHQVRDELRSVLEKCKSSIPTEQILMPGIKEVGIKETMVSFFRYLINYFYGDENEEWNERYVNKFGNILSRCGAEEIGGMIITNSDSPEAVFLIFFEG